MKDANNLTVTMLSAIRGGSDPLVRKIVIVGGGCGGGTAAQFARKTDRTSEITIIERETYPQYSRCGLPYGISGIIPELTNLIEAPEERLKKNRISLMLSSEVTHVDK